MIVSVSLDVLENCGGMEKTLAFGLLCCKADILKCEKFKI